MPDPDPNAQGNQNQGGQGNQDDQTPKTVTVKVDGEDREVTQEELVKGYGLEAAARKKMETVAEERKTLDEDVLLAQTVRQVATDQDEDSMRQMVKLLGMPAAEADAAIEQIRKMGEAGEGTANEEGGEEPPKTGYDDLAPELKALIDKGQAAADRDEQQSLVDLKEKMFAQADKAIDTDEILGKIADGGLKKRVKRDVRREVQRRVGLEGQAWPDVLQEIVQESRGDLKHIGNLTNAEGGQASSAIGPAAAMGFQATPTGPTERVSSTDPTYSKNVGTRLRELFSKHRAAQE